MKIGIDISQIVYRGSGVSRFTDGLVSAICKYDKKNEWIFFFSSLRQTLEEDVKNKIKKRGFKLVEKKIPPTGLSLLWNDIHALRVETLIGKVDWFISSDWTEPPSSARKATILHDLAFLKHPETVADIIKKTQAKRLEWVRSESELVFCDSEATKEDALEYFYEGEKKLAVNYPGVETIAPTKTQIVNAKKKFKLDKPFILTVGKIEPRKNLPRLIEAYSAIHSPKPELIIVGSDGWGPEVAPQENVRLLGFISDDELSALYSECLFFIYPSIWEGFGYPVVEAMKLGAPVTTSNTSSLAEIGKGSALLFNPHQASDIQKAMETMIKSEVTRKSYAAKGKKKAAEFTWKRYYDSLIRSLSE